MTFFPSLMDDFVGKRKIFSFLLQQKSRLPSLHEYLDYGTENTKTRKSLICLQKLKNSNLEILKFEARFAYAVKFWTDFFD